MEIFRQKEWIKTLLGYGVNSVSIHFDQQQLEETLGELVKNGELTAIEGEPAPEAVVIDEEKNFSIIEALKISKSLQGFFSKSQLKAIVENCRGEEKQFFYDKMKEMSGIIKKMPKTYDQEEKGDDAIAYLHYFKGSYDFYITEKDMEEIQYQAFGLAVMAEAELGYISIVELIENDFEIDLFFIPQSISELKKRHK
ncbi:MAG: hypothetical protein KAI17_07500 [Thiotrichaceae bacterium]|nr:hypothetical protein [Thiotrichaceae bacterium]